MRVKLENIIPVFLISKAKDPTKDLDKALQNFSAATTLREAVEEIVSDNNNINNNNKNSVNKDCNMDFESTIIAQIEKTEQTQNLSNENKEKILEEVNYLYKTFIEAIGKIQTTEPVIQNVQDLYNITLTLLNVETIPTFNFDIYPYTFDED